MKYFIVTIFFEESTSFDTLQDENAVPVLNSNLMHALFNMEGDRPASFPARPAFCHFLGGAPNLKIWPLVAKKGRRLEWNLAHYSARGENGIRYYAWGRKPSPVCAALQYPWKEISLNTFPKSVKRMLEQSIFPWKLSGRIMGRRYGWLNSPVYILWYFWWASPPPPVPFSGQWNQSWPWPLPLKLCKVLRSSAHVIDFHSIIPRNPVWLIFHDFLWRLVFSKKKKCTSLVCLPFKVVQQ